MTIALTNKDLAPERQAHIAELVREHGTMRVDALSRELGVSAATVRRDLEALERKGLIRRVHGGAMSSTGRLEEPLFDDKTDIAPAEKRRIAERAAQYVKSGDTVYLDGGSTILELARLLKERTDITIVTNSLRAAVELSHSDMRVIVVGGELRPRSQTIVGPLTRTLLDELHFDVAFMGTIGMSLKEGLTTTDPGEAFTKQQVMQHADQIVLLCHSQKIGKVSFARAGDISTVNVVLTDSGVEAATRRELEKRTHLVVV